MLPEGYVSYDQYIGDVLKHLECKEVYQFTSAASAKGAAIRRGILDGISFGGTYVFLLLEQGGTFNH
jgi:hypothetical protein